MVHVDNKIVEAFMNWGPHSHIGFHNAGIQDVGEIGREATKLHNVLELVKVTIQFLLPFQSGKTFSNVTFTNWAVGIYKDAGKEV